MNRARFVTIAAAAILLPATAGAQQTPPAPQTYTLAATLVRTYQNLQRNLTEAAEKMPETDYAFKPTTEVRPFGQLVAHVALSQFGTCAALKADPAPPHKDEMDMSGMKMKH